MKTYEVDGHVQIVSKGDISCSCGWATAHPYNYKRGEQICKHIKKLIKIINGKNINK